MAMLLRALLLTFIIANPIGSFCQEMMPVYGHSSGINSLCFSPNGKYLASGSFNETKIRIWDISNKRLFRLIDGLMTFPRSLDYSSDGKFLVAGCAAYRVYIYHTANYELFYSIKDTSIIGTVKFSPNSQLLAIAREDGLISIWDVIRERELKTFRNQKSSISSISFSSDSRFLAAAGDNVEIWDLETYNLVKTISSQDEKHNVGRGFKVVKFLDDTQLLTYGPGILIVKWSIEQNKILNSIDIREVNVYAGQTLTVSPDKRFIATFPGVSFNYRTKDRIYELQIWDLSGFNLIEKHEIKIRQGEAIDWAVDSKIAVGGAEGRIEIFDLVSSDNELQIGEYYKICEQNQVNTILSLDKRRILAVSYDKSITAENRPIDVVLWDTQTGMPSLRLRGHRDVISAMAYADGKDLLFTASHDNTIKVWDLNNGNNIHTFLAHTKEVRILAVSPNERMLASFDNNKNLILWDLDTKTIKNTINTNWMIYSLKFSSDSQTLITICSDSTIKILGSNSLETVSSIKLEHTTTEFEILPTSSFVLAPGLQNHFGLWEMKSGNLVKSFHHQKYASNLTLAENGEFMFSTYKNSINLWDTFKGTSIRKVITDNDDITSMAYDNLNKLLFTGDEAGKIQVRTLNGQLLLTSMILPNEEWLSYTPEGYFTGSKLCHEFVGFVQNDTISYPNDLIEKFHNGRKVTVALLSDDTSFFLSTKDLYLYLSIVVIIISGTAIFYRKSQSQISKDKKNKRIKGRPIQQSLMNNSDYKRDVFLSHAREDRKRYVLPLAKALQRRGISYWLDDAEIKWGDNITEKINEGLQTSRFVIVFISSSFLSKKWPKSELNTALTLENNRNQKVVLPLLIEKNKNILEQYSLILPKLYLEWSIGASKIAKSLRELLDAEKIAET